MKTPANKPVKKTATKRRAFAAPSSRAGASGSGSKVENPFDKFANARKKHEVLNRRVKGEDRNVGRAREKAIDERKTKLLRDYQSNKKSNVIVDKRFGENDPTMSLEERMFMRFQKEKVKNVRNSSAFNLESGDTEVLTHKGQVLGSSNLEDNDWVSSDDEDGGGRLNKQVVEDMHFGGGFQQKRGGSEELALPPKGRLDALQEIVMKSKLHKMQKKEAREEQEEERSKLDKAYQELFSSSMLDFNPTGADKKFGRDRNAAGGSEAMDSYDLALREMTYEAKLPASERTKTAEEIALEEQKRIEALEEARLKRMKAPLKRQPEEEDGTADGRATKRKYQNDDELEEGAFRVDTKGGKKGRGKEQQAEDEQQGIVDGEEYRKYIMQDEEYSDSDDSGSGGEDDGEDDEDNEGDGEEDDEEESGEEDGAEEESDGDSDGDGEGGLDDEEYSYNSDGEGSDDEDSEGANDSEEDSEAEEPAPTKKAAATKAVPAAPASQKKATLPAAEPAKAPAAPKRAKAEAPVDVEDGVNIEMPHKIDCPPDLEAFDELVAQYVLNGNKDMCALIDRILAWNNVNLPGAEGKENRNLMHNFLDVLLKHLVRVGDSLPALDTLRQGEAMQMADYLSGVVFKVSTDLGEQSCAALWGRTIKILHSQLQKRLRDYAQGERSQSCWPSLGRLFLLQLLGRVFSVTDLRNDVVGPATLFLCQCLAQCPVATTADVSSGLLAASIVFSYHAEARRYVPEVVAFVHTVLSLYGTDLQPPGRKPQNFQNTFSLSHLSAVREQASQAKCTASEAKVQWYMFSAKEDILAGRQSVMAVSILSTAYRLFESIVALYDASNALPEICGPIIATLRGLRPHAKPQSLPAWVQERHLAILEHTLARCEAVRTKRQPLQWRKAALATIETKAPRFQLDYTFKKDHDADHDRAKVKQLTRQLKREKKAAMRELRRDSDFIDQERFKEQQAAKEFRRAERVKNYGFMEQQQATINQQVRKGHGLMKGGGSGVAKKARIKRL